MSNLKDLKNQNLVIDFPIGGKKVDPKTGKLLGYFADVQRAQIPVNNTRRGVIYQNPHVCNRKVDYCGKSINNHRMFVDVETVHKMMQAAQKNNEIVYHFKSGDKDEKQFLEINAKVCCPLNIFCKIAGCVNFVINWQLQLTTISASFASLQNTKCNWIFVCLSKLIACLTALDNLISATQIFRWCLAKQPQK